MLSDDEVSGKVDDIEYNLADIQKRLGKVEASLREICDDYYASKGLKHE